MSQVSRTVEAAQVELQNAVDRIPPDAWPMIDIAFRITIALAVLWLLLSLVAWWRRRAYNLTVASTARRSKKAQPDFLKVDKKARAKAVDRGEAHEEVLEKREREEELAALKASKEPIGIAKRLAKLSSLVMSIFTLGTAISGVVLNVGRMGEYVEEATTAGKLQYILQEHTIGVIVVVVIVVIHIYQFFIKKKWEG